MKVKTELLQAFLDKYGITAAILAREMGAGNGSCGRRGGKTFERYVGMRRNGAAVYLLLWRGRGC